MAEYLILKAVELADTAAAFRKQYKTVQDLRAAGWWLQRKYDGCFGMAVIREGGGNQMLSRTGKDYSASSYHILAELTEACNASYGMGWHSRTFLGEVWHPDLDFHTISGTFRRLSAPAPTATKLRFIVNDMLPGTAPGPSIRTYARRYGDIKDLGLKWHGTHIELVENEDEWDPWAAALEWQGAGGYDGAILRDPDAGYSIGKATSGQIVKVKPTLSLDLRVLDVLPGEGKHSGKAGALRCDLGGGKFVDVGTGLTDDDRDEFWVCREAMIAPHKTIVEVEAMGWSKEGKLREPRFKGVRFDKETADR